MAARATPHQSTGVPLLTLMTGRKHDATATPAVQPGDLKPRHHL